jgi:glycosyltransferase involved in cell wall biosynthesis
LSPKVLHILSQRPSLTGSGVTLDALVRHAGEAGWEQRVICGVPDDDPFPAVADLPSERIHPLRFERGALDFPVPGMSDVMPYRSTRFSSLSATQVEVYRSAWSDHLRSVTEKFGPDVIHVHHLWLLAAGLKAVLPQVPVLDHCHATGLRQMELCPHLADTVRAGCARNERFAVLLKGHAAALAEALSVAPDRIRVVGAGYNDALFHAGGDGQARAESLVYVGKYSPAKGLPQLLDAFERLRAIRPGLRLHVAGTGAGVHADALRLRMRSMAPAVVLHGQLDQSALSDLLRACGVCVLPSFYEGLPLVLVEALACGCRLVASALPGVVEQLAPHLGEALGLVDLPPMRSVDVPEPNELPAFVDGIAVALEHALSAGPVGDPRTALPGALETFTWRAVFSRVEAIWLKLIGERDALDRSGC